MLDSDEKRISLAAFKAAPHARTDNVRGLIEAHGQSMDITAYPAMVEVLAQGKTLKLLENDLPLALRIIPRLEGAAQPNVRFDSSMNSGTRTERP